MLLFARALTRTRKWLGIRGKFTRSVQHYNRADALKRAAHRNVRLDRKTVTTLNKKLLFAGCASLIGVVGGGYAARLPNRVPGTSGLVPAGFLEWLALIVVLSAGAYCAALISRHLRTLGVTGPAVAAGIFAASIPCAAIAALILTLVFYNA